MEILGEYATVEYCDFINNNAYSGDYWLDPQYSVDDFIINGADIINYTENGISKSLDLRGKSDEEKGQAVDGVLGNYFTWENLHLIGLKPGINITSVKKHMTSYAGAAKVVIQVLKRYLIIVISSTTPQIGMVAWNLMVKMVL